MRNSPRPAGGIEGELGRRPIHNSADVIHGVIPFAERFTCTIAEACEVTGLGRTKIYELIGGGYVSTTTIGRRRLVLVRSLRALLVPDEA